MNAVTPPAAAVPCFYCARGPTGTDGHAYLLVRSIGSTLTLQCQLCRGFWKRTQTSPGICAWEDITERAAHGADRGVSVPPRSVPEKLR